MVQVEDAHEPSVNEIIIDAVLSHTGNGNVAEPSSVAVRLGPLLAGPALCVSALRGVLLLFVV